jgi:hypothetical protein
VYTKKIKSFPGMHNPGLVLVQLQAKTAQHLPNLFKHPIAVTPQQDNEIITVPNQISAYSRHLEHLIKRV